MKRKYWHHDIDITAILGAIVFIGIITMMIVCIVAEVGNNKEKSYIVSGYVVDKIYQPAYTTYVSVGSDNTRHIIPTYHEATYTIVVESDNKEHKAYYNVTSSVYDRIKIDDYLRNVNRELK